MYNSDQDNYAVSYAGYILLFERVGGLYFYDASDPKVLANNTVRGNKLKYTKRLVKKAEEATRIRRRLFFPSDEAIPRLSTINNITGIR